MLGCFRRPTLYARSGKPSMARLYPGVSRYARPGQSGRARSGRAEPCSAAFGDPPCTPDLASRAWLGSARVSAGTPGPASRAGPSSGRAEPCSAALSDPPCAPDPASRAWLGSTQVSAGTPDPASRAWLGSTRVSAGTPDPASRAWRGATRATVFCAEYPPAVGQRVVCPNTSSMTNWLPKKASSSSAIAVRVQCTALAPRHP